MENPAWQAATASATAIMVFPTPGGPSRVTLDLALTNSKVAKVADLAGIQVGLEGEVELVQGLVVRQPGKFERVAEPAALAQTELFFEEQVDEVEVAHLAGLGTFDELGDHIGEVGQPEPGGVVADPVGGQAAHRFSPCVLVAAVS
jgi:hypothetical protein